MPILDKGRSEEEGEARQEKESGTKLVGAASIDSSLEYPSAHAFNRDELRRSGRHT